MKQRIYNLSKGFAVAAVITLGIVGAAQAETAGNAPQAPRGPAIDA